MLIFVLFASHCSVHGCYGDGDKSSNTLNNQSNEFLNRKVKLEFDSKSEKQENFRDKSEENLNNLGEISTKKLKKQGNEKSSESEDYEEKKSKIEDKNFDLDKSNIDKHKDKFFLNRLLNSGDKSFKNELENDKEYKIDIEKMVSSEEIINSYLNYSKEFYDECMKKYVCSNDFVGLTFTNSCTNLGDSSDYPEKQSFEIRFSPTFFLDMFKRIQSTRVIDPRKIGFEIKDSQGFIFKGSCKEYGMQGPVDLVEQRLGKVESYYCGICAKGDYMRFKVTTDRLLNRSDISGSEYGACFNLKDGDACDVIVYYEDIPVLVSEKVKAKKVEVFDSWDEKFKFSEFKHPDKFNETYWRSILRQLGLSKKTESHKLVNLFSHFDGVLKNGEIEV